MKLPEKVKVGPKLWKIKIEPEPFVNDFQNGVNAGECRHNECTIRVIRSHPDNMYVLFWHELMHAIDDLANTNLTEDQISRLAPLIAMVLKDNGMLKGSR